MDHRPLHNLFMPATRRPTQAISPVPFSAECSSEFMGKQNLQPRQHPCRAAGKRDFSIYAHSFDSRIDRADWRNNKGRSPWNPHRAAFPHSLVLDTARRPAEHKRLPISASPQAWRLLPRKDVLVSPDRSTSPSSPSGSQPPGSPHLQQTSSISLFFDKDLYLGGRIGLQKFHGPPDRPEAGHVAHRLDFGPAEPL